MKLEDIALVFFPLRAMMTLYAFAKSFVKPLLEQFAIAAYILKQLIDKYKKLDYIYNNDKVLRGKQMKANYEDKIQDINSAKTEIAFGNLYELNKQLMAREPILDNETIEKEKIPDLVNWLSDNYSQKYFMLLCNELKDYTIFNLKANMNNDIEDKLYQASKDVIECMSNRGSILSIELQPEGGWEFWIRTPEGSFAYYFFPYGAAVLEY